MYGPHPRQIAQTNKQTNTHTVIKPTRLTTVIDSSNLQQKDRAKCTFSLSLSGFSCCFDSTQCIHILQLTATLEDVSLFVALIGFPFVICFLFPLTPNLASVLGLALAYSNVHPPISPPPSEVYIASFSLSLHWLCMYLSSPSRG